MFQTSYTVLHALIAPFLKKYIFKKNYIFHLSVFLKYIQRFF